MTYLSECLADSPTVIFPMSSYSSGYADSSGNARDLNVLSGTAPASTATGPDGVANDAAAWGASAGYLRTTYATTGPQSGTYEFWFRYAAAPAANLILTTWCPSSGSSGNISYVAIYGAGANAGKLSFAIGATAIDSPSALSTGAWHHVVCSWDASGGMTMRVDKTTLNTTSAPTAANRTGISLRVHGYWSGSADILQTGAVDMAWVGFYPAKLSDARTDAHYDAMSGGSGVTGTLAATLAGATLAASGTETFSGTLAATTGDATLVASGTVANPVTGTFAATLPVPTTSFTGTYAAPPTGSLAATLTVPTVDFTGTYAPPPNPTGSFAATLPVPAVDYTGGYTPPAQTGTFAATLPAPVPDFTGTYTPPTITGTFGASLPVPVVDFAGLSGDIFGSFAVTLPPPVVALSGSYGGPYPTDTSNLFDGLDMVCVGIVTKTAPAVTPPTNVGVKQDKALAYPLPVMVNGRPT